MKTIHKLRLHLVEDQMLYIPNGSKFLHVDEQYNELKIWFECDPTLPPKNFEIIVCGTGHQLHKRATRYIGTAIVDELVWHVYEGEEQP